MKTFVISLQRSIERRERIQQCFDTLGINFEFFDAIDGMLDNFQYSNLARPSITKKRKGYELKTNEIACFASHLAIWHRCVELNEVIVVIEDNVDPIHGAREAMEVAYQKAFHYDYIKLSATHKSTFTSFTSLSSGYEFGAYSKRTCGTIAYIISPKAAQLFINNARAIIEPVDDYMEKPWQHNVQTYSVRPDLFARADIVSTIGCERKIKTGITALNKLYIELFRVYESIMKALYWKNKKQKTKNKEPDPCPS